MNHSKKKEKFHVQIRILSNKTNTTILKFLLINYPLVGVVFAV